MSNNIQSDASLDELSHQLYEDGLTDGLSVIPPTEDRVQEMLRGTDHSPDHVLGRLGNTENPLTVERLAANAVMAGCVPSYMPVLEAGARAMDDPKSNTIQISVSTGSWAYFWMVNGPVRDKLNIESGSGAFGPNFHANQSIARALGMAYRNTAKIYPGEQDMGVMGNPGKFSLLAGENQDASPWEPYHVTHGYDADESTITIGAPNSWVQWLPSENTAEHVVEGMILNTPRSMRGDASNRYFENDATIFHLINPYNAEELGKADLTKAEIKEYMVENSWVEVNRFIGAPGDVDEEATLSSRQYRQYYDTGAIKMFVVGGAGRVNAMAGMSLGGPVTKKIEFPNGWEELAEEYELTPDWFPDEGFYD